MCEHPRLYLDGTNLVFLVERVLSQIGAEVADAKEDVRCHGYRAEHEIYLKNAALSTNPIARMFQDQSAKNWGQIKKIVLYFGVSLNEIEQYDLAASDVKFSIVNNGKGSMDTLVSQCEFANPGLLPWKISNSTVSPEALLWIKDRCLYNPQKEGYGDLENNIGQLVVIKYEKRIS
jgi:hypothetical protein